MRQQTKGQKSKYRTIGERPTPGVHLFLMLKPGGLIPSRCNLINVFTYQGAGGSLRDRFSYGEVRARAKTLALVSSSLTGETNKEPRITFLEHYIHHKGLAGEREALREALFAYLRAWGVSC